MPTTVTTTIDETIDPARARALLQASPALATAPRATAEHAPLLKRTKDGSPRTSYANVVACVRWMYGSPKHRSPACPDPRLSFNEMTLTPLLDGEPQREGRDLSILRERIELDFNLPASAENVKAAVIQVAHERSFHPVRAYLDSLPPWDGVSRLADLSERVLFLRATADDGSTPLHMIFLRKWLIAAVARAYDPGCKVDTALVLYGRQGVRKSEFFRILAGMWFGDTQMDLSNKDALLQLHSAWIYEWSEIDRITSQKHASEIKAFITTQIDIFRAPYAAAVAKHPRSGIIVGSTNKKKFLTDPTGNRRFHVIDVDHLDPKAGQTLGIAALAELRDALWAEAIALYRTGGTSAQHWLTADEEAANAEHSEQYLVDADPWVELIERFIATKTAKGPLNPLLYPQDQITTAILFESLKIDPALRTQPQAVRIGAAMERIGWESAVPRVRYGDRKTVRMWLPKSR